MQADSDLVNRCLESQNRRPRRPEERLEFVIIHGTWMPGDEPALARLTDPAVEVSCHYYITRTGEVIQLVKESDVAYHAGRSRAFNSADVEVEGLNPWSLGIELANSGPFEAGIPSPEQELIPDWSLAEPYTQVQYDVLIKLLKDIETRHPGISPLRILGHYQVSAGRKSDPGPHFDWGQLVNGGVCA